jgi:hypothetical protein
MCGIFGAIKARPDATVNYGILRALAILNRERGTDALGFFNSKGHIKKVASDPKKVLTFNKVNKWLQNSERADNWFIVGHTRNGTRGANTNKNAHPYRYGRITGAHNGCVSAPKEYAVDSQFLFDSLEKKDGYQAALEEISGYWGLVWTDGVHLFLAVHNCEIAVAEVGGVWYFSSDYSHLEAATGVGTYPMVDGEVIRFSADGTNITSSDDDSELAEFESKSTDVSDDWLYYKSYTGTGGGSYKGSNYAPTGNTTDNTPASRYGEYSPDEAEWQGDTLVNKDYDGEWRDAWLAYQEENSAGIHSMNDAEFNENHS